MVRRSSYLGVLGVPSNLGLDLLSCNPWRTLGSLPCARDLIIDQSHKMETVSHRFDLVRLFLAGRFVQSEACPLGLWEVLLFIDVFT